MFALVSMLFTVALSALVFFVGALWPDTPSKADESKVVRKPATRKHGEQQYDGFVLFDTHQQF